MRWRIILRGSSNDIDRLLAEQLDGISATSDPSELHLEIDDGEEGDDVSDESQQKARTLIQAAVRHLNGVGKLRWGRVFEGISPGRVSYLDAEENELGQVVFLETVHVHLGPEEYADFVASLGLPRPPLPAGVDELNALKLDQVAALAATDPDVARVLHLIELMLEGDDQIDWAAGYSALEIIKEHARRGGTTGHGLGLWTRRELQRYEQMANSFEAVGILSRHPGRRYDAPNEPCLPRRGLGFVRRAAARWITRLPASDVTL